MARLSLTTTYDRKLILDEAARARGKGRRKRAIELYRRVVAVEPRTAELLARLAPLLAKDGQTYDAWRSFREAAREYTKAKKPLRVLEIYREAVQDLPREVDAWLAAAKIEAGLGRKREALETLLEGRRQFRGRRRRAQAIALLRRARGVAPEHGGVALDLVRQLMLSDQRWEALRILDDLARVEGVVPLRRVRWLQLRLTRSTGHLWLWLRSLFVRSLEEEEDDEPSMPRVRLQVAPPQAADRAESA